MGQLYVNMNKLETKDSDLLSPQHVRYSIFISEIRRAEERSSEASPGFTEMFRCSQHDGNPSHLAEEQSNKASPEFMKLI